MTISKRLHKLELLKRVHKDLIEIRSRLDYLDPTDMDLAQTMEFMLNRNRQKFNQLIAKAANWKKERCTYNHT